MMLKIKEMANGRIKNEEVFQNVKEAINYLEVNDFFSWILDEEPERELPDFTGVTEVYEIANIFREYDYSWWTMEVEESYEVILNLNLGDYNIKVYEFEDDILSYLSVEYHENVGLDNLIIYLEEKDFERLYSIFEDFDDMEIDEQNDAIRFFEDCFHI